MTTDIQTNKFILIYIDGSVKEISEEQKDKIYNYNGKSFELDGGLVMMSSISKILPLDEYYRQYPNKRPYQPENQFDNYSESALDKYYTTPTATEKIKIAFEKQYKMLYANKNIMENSLYLKILSRYNKASK